MSLISSINRDEDLEYKTIENQAKGQHSVQNVEYKTSTTSRILPIAHILEFSSVLEKQSLFCSYCIVNTSDCISSIQNLIQFFVIVKLSLFQLWLSKGSLLELSLSIEVSFSCDWAKEVSWSCPWAKNSLSCVIEQLVIWHYILVELSLEVQGGQDYFRFVEGTCIIAYVRSLSVLLLIIRCTRLWTHSDSELFQTLSLRTVLERKGSKVFETHNSTPPSSGFSHLQLVSERWLCI